MRGDGGTHRDLPVLVDFSPVNDSSFVRILNDPALDGATNMALDEALLTRVGRGESQPTLRFYQWNPPTISLGYFQPYSAYEKLSPPAGELAVVRRLTGGGAILHDLELTYSLILPVDHALMDDGPRRLYELAHDAVIETLAGLSIETARCGETDDSTPTRGPFFCFERRHCFDVLMGRDKLAGSAQRRTRDALLQHGSIILGNRFEQQQTARPSIEMDDTVRALRENLPSRLAQNTGIPFARGQWTTDELQTTVTLIAKYQGSDWVRRT